MRDAAILEVVLQHRDPARASCLRLRLADVDFGNGTIKVTGKGSKQRIVPFGRKAGLALRAYLACTARLAGARDPDPRTCSSPCAESRMNPKGVNRPCEPYIGMVSEIEKKSPHVLRHTFATHLAEPGSRSSAVKELLGHESLSTTQMYTHVSVDRLRKVYAQAHPKAS